MGEGREKRGWRGGVRVQIGLAASAPVSRLEGQAFRPGQGRGLEWYTSHGGSRASRGRAGISSIRFS